MNRFLGKILCLILLCVTLPAEAYDFSAHGYLRHRFHGSFNLDTQSNATNNNDRFGLIQYNQMRLRVEPALKVNDQLSLHSQFDVLDNITYGSSVTEQLAVHDPVVGTFALPAGAGSLSFNGGAAGENGSINIRRVYMDILSPIGKFRLGRQPAHWGLGILINDGNTSDGDFGDTVDGVTYLAQKTFTGEQSLSIGALWDIAYESQRDPRVGGLAAAIRENGQDTNQFGALLLYERPDFDFGVFGALRKRDGSAGTTTTATNLAGTSVDAGIDGNTLMWVVDAYAQYRYREYTFSAEYARIMGKITTGVALDAIAFSGLTGSGIIELPAAQSLGVNMGALEFEAIYPWGSEITLKGGFAQGDASPLSSRITQYGFRPDYQIALLMFRYPLGTSPGLRDGTTGTLLAGNVPITGNFINNTYYAALTYMHRLDIKKLMRQADDFKIGARAVTAFAHVNPVNLDFSILSYDATTTGTTALPSLQSRGKWYGIEGDLLLEARLFENLLVNLEAGVLVPQSAFDINTNNPGGVIASIATDAAEIAYAGRLSLSMEF